MGVVQLSEGEAKDIMVKVEEIVRGAYHLGRNFSGAILHLPEQFGGYGVKCDHTQMVCEQAKMVISALRRLDNTGEKTKIRLEYHQLESGGRTVVLKKGVEMLGLLTQTWMVKFLRNMRKSEMEIAAEHWVPDADRGEEIMERLEECGVSGEEW